jgi:YidC/Oxa1 family membrane protein insertase
VTENGAPIAALLAWPAGLGDMDNTISYATSTIETSHDGHIEHLESKKVSGGATVNGPFQYAGVGDQYFAAIFLPVHPDDATMVTLNREMTIKNVAQGVISHAMKAVHDSKATIPVPVLGAAMGSTTGTVQTRIFVGPKDWSVLESVHTADGGTIQSVLDFGFWGIIGKPLFLGLRGVHGWIAPAHPGPHDYSWGWAIILFTTILYLGLTPLRYQGMKGMLKMQRIQPQIDAIKAKYKNPKPTDPKTGEMNAEIMALQKKNGVSMFGGCIPSLIQFPLLIAFFTMMTRVVELRHAHWFWLPDLSQADPYHILPVFVVLSMFLVQFYTPTPGMDPAQAKMMAFTMPLISGVWTWDYASGLALYWAMSSVIQVAQQAVMNRTELGREMKQLQVDRAARKLQAKKASGAPAGGRTIQGRR